MPINKKENLVYTFLMVIVMASVMTGYNIIFHQGFSLESLKQTWLVFPITFTIAFIVEWFLASKIALFLISKIIKEEDPLPKKILVSALCFVTQMVILMSVIGSILFNDFDSNWFQTY